MKIAVASQNRRQVTEHAGRCRRFWVYEILDNKVQAKRLLELPKEQSFHDSPHSGPHPLDMVKVLITGGMGRGLARRLQARGIKGIATDERDPDKAIAAYLEGSLIAKPAGCHTHETEPA